MLKEAIELMIKDENSDDNHFYSVPIERFNSIMDFVGSAESLFGAEGGKRAYELAREHEPTLPSPETLIEILASVQAS